MPDNSFDVVSKIDLNEVSNAIQQALKEIHTRFDLKDSKSNIELEKDAMVLHSADEYKLKAVNDILAAKAGKTRSFPERPDLRPGRIRRRRDGQAQESPCSKGSPSKKPARS